MSEKQERNTEDAWVPNLWRLNDAFFDLRSLLCEQGSRRLYRVERSDLREIEITDNNSASSTLATLSFVRFYVHESKKKWQFFSNFYLSIFTMQCKTATLSGDFIQESNVARMLNSKSNGGAWWSGNGESIIYKTKRNVIQSNKKAFEERGKNLGLQKGFCNCLFSRRSKKTTYSIIETFVIITKLWEIPYHIKPTV